MHALHGTALVCNPALFTGCGAFHRAHQALYTHHLLETTDSDWGICEVNLMPGNDCILIENLRKQQLLYTVAEKGADNTVLKVIGSMKEALHPELDGCDGILQAMARPQTAIVSLTVTEKGYCTDAASGQLDLNNPLIKHDLANPAAPKSAIGYIVQALHLRREQGLAAFTVMSCDNVRENGHVAKVAVLGLAQARDPQLAQWIEANATFPCTMVDRIVPAATPETLQEIADQLGVYDPCAIACEPFRQWVIEDNFVNGRPDWDKVGAQFVADVVPFEMMKLRMLNGSHSFLAYLGYLGGYETIADTMTNPAYRKAAFALMMQEQAPTLSMPEGTDLSAYATLLIERFSNPSLRHRTGRLRWMAARNCRSACWIRCVCICKTAAAGVIWHWASRAGCATPTVWMNRGKSLMLSTQCRPNSSALTNSSVEPNG